MVRRKKKKSFLKGFVIVLCLLVPLVAWLALSRRGILKVYRMDLERQRCIDRISALKKENKELMDEIRRLKKDPDYVEKVARQELGLIRKNEVIYRFTDLPLGEHSKTKELQGRSINEGKQ